MHPVRFLLIILSILLVALIAVLLSPRILPARTCATSRYRIAAVGDSLVEGYGATTHGGFVTLLSQRAGIPIENFGVIGDTAADAEKRLNLVLSIKPDITFVLLGGNDALQHLPETDTEQHLAKIISALQKNGSRVILLGVPGGFVNDPYPFMFERLAQTYGVTYVPNVLSGLIGHPDLMSDEVHPNESGYQRLAGRLLPVLEKECAK